MHGKCASCGHVQHYRHTRGTRLAEIPCAQCGKAELKGCLYDGSPVVRGQTDPKHFRVQQLREDGTLVGTRYFLSEESARRFAASSWHGRLRDVVQRREPNGKWAAA